MLTLENFWPKTCALYQHPSFLPAQCLVTHGQDGGGGTPVTLLPPPLTHLAPAALPARYSLRSPALCVKRLLSNLDGSNTSVLM